MIKISFLITLLTSFLCVHASCWAFPLKLEMWFLSPPKTGASFVLKKGNTDFRKFYLAQNCTQKMGDYCFDPQIGLYKDDKEKTPVSIMEDKKLEVNVEDSTSRKGRFLSSVDSDIITCDKNYYFDLYCGKANTSVADADAPILEVWIDISSSFREVDPDDKNGDCDRKRFVNSLESACGQNVVRFMMFDTSLKSMPGAQSACTSYGLNDQDRLLKWIEDSNAKKLIIITDISELSEKLSNFLEQHSYSVRGDMPKKELVASGMNNLVSELALSCQDKSSK